MKVLPLLHKTSAKTSEFFFIIFVSMSENCQGSPTSFSIVIRDKSKSFWSHLGLFPVTVVFLRKLITSIYVKSPIFLGFNPILQKFYEMICEILDSKTMCGILLVFWYSYFINNFVVKTKFRNRKIIKS